MKKSKIERAVITESHLVIAAKSLTRYHDFERDRINAFSRLAREELAKTENSKKRNELLQALRENETEQITLERGWENSSLRRRLTKIEQAEAPISAIEHRLFAPGRESLLAEPTEYRARGDKVTLFGYAAIFDKLSVNFGGWKEKIQPGAFDEVLKSKPDVRALMNHNSDLLLARTRNKTLRLYSDAMGLLYYADLIGGDALGEAVARRVERQDLSGNSFSFIPKKDKWILAEPGGIDTRILLEVAELFDVGPVTFPAFPDTTVAVEIKSVAQHTYTREDFLRDQDEVDEILMQEIEKKQQQNRREHERKYRLAGRIINRNGGRAKYKPPLR